jgi:hypothetical protein
MRKPVLTIFYQFNPENTAIGGIQTLIQTFIKYALKVVGARLVGTDGDSMPEISKGLRIGLFLLFKLKNARIRDLIPHITKYISAFFGCNLASDFMDFCKVRGSLVLIWGGLSERLEATVLIRGWRREKTLFIHNNIQPKITAKGYKKAICWRLNLILAANTEATRSKQQQYPQLRHAFGGQLSLNSIKPINNFFDEAIYKDILQRWDGRIYTEKIVI